MLYDFPNSPVAISVEPSPELIETATRTPKGTVIVPSRCCDTIDEKPILINGITVKVIKSA